MKKTNIILLALALVSTSAFAKSTGSAKSMSDTASYSRSAPQSGGGSFGLGLTTFTAFGGTGAISALIPVGSNVIQTTLGLGTSGGFSIAASGLFKATVAGNSDTGLHLGGGLGLGVGSSGSVTVAGFTVAGGGGASFSLMLGGVIGLHHELVANKIAMSFDAGPVITVLPGVAFSIAPLSTLAGFSVHYFL